MENNRVNKSFKTDIKRNTEETLPFCMKAPDAEHLRSHDNDEPCDDSRTGKFSQRG